MKDPTPLHVAAKAADPSVVDQLRELLEDAQQGRIDAIAWAVVGEGRETGHGWVASENRRGLGAPLLGEVTIMQHALADAMVEE